MVADSAKIGNLKKNQKQNGSFACFGGSSSTSKLKYSLQKNQQDNYQPGEIAIEGELLK